jgi:hypothetical protein
LVGSSVLGTVCTVCTDYLCRSRAGDSCDRGTIQRTRGSPSSR